MSAKPLADAYEKLKGLRRQGELPELTDDECLERLANAVTESSDSSAGEIEDLIKRLAVAVAAEEPEKPGCLIRLFEIKPLAERVFGDEQKANSWLNRANSLFSGQRPIDLLQDELGTAVVREALEQIDHGIFS
jgi:hypothetical protein